jgi:hypothetical protein
VTSRGAIRGDRTVEQAARMEVSPRSDDGVR